MLDALCRVRKSSSPHRKIDAPTAGDIGKLIVIALSLSFLTCIVMEHHGLTAFFSDSYKREGFCISNTHMHPMYQSHAISFCFNTMLSLVMCSLVHLGRWRFAMSETALKPINKNALTLLAHGLGHCFLALCTVNLAKERGGEPEYSAAAAFETLSRTQQAAAVVVLFFVWFAFMRDSRRKLSTTILWAFLHNSLQVFVIPTRFFFTHVLMAVPLHSGVRAIFFRARSQKDIYYAMEAWLVDVPILLMSFGEAIACEDFLVHYGGHVWFDMVVPIGFIVYYMILVIGGKTWRDATSASKEF